MKQNLGHFEIVAELGRGGMGVVYKGYDAALDRHVALKVLSPALAHEPSVRERFLREARSMAALNDPHIIQVFYIGVDNDQPFFAMEFVEGENLGSLLKREGRIDPTRAREILLKVASGLAVAHDKGVIHRDIKPGNIMLTKRGGVKLADFGIALATQQDISKKLTSTGEFVGTPGYLSPEVCLGKTVDQRSDIFSLGIVLFEMLTGTTPFSDESPLGLMLEVVRSEIPDVRQVNHDVDDGTYAVLKKMVAKDPDERYQDCHEIVEDLVALGTSMISTGPHRLSASGLHAAGALTPAPGAVSKQTVATPIPTAAPATRSTVQSVAATQLRASAPPVPPPSPPALAREPSAASRSGVLWPVAAMLALLVSGAAVTAIAFKDRLWPTVGTEQASNVPPQTLTASNEPSPTTTAGETSVAAPATVVATTPATAQGAQAGDHGTVASGDAVATTAPAASEPAASELAQIAADLRAATEELRAARSAEPAASTSTNAADDHGHIDDDTDPEAEEYEAEELIAANTVAAPRPRQGVAETLRERQRMRVENAANRTVSEPVAEPQASAGPPRVFVMSTGDSGAAAVAENVIEGALLDAGISITDESFASGIGGLLSRSQRDLPAALAGALRARRGDVLVLVRVVPLGQQTITFYGQSDVLTTASLEIMLLSLGERRLLGRPITTRIDYTGMSAIDKATEAVEPQLATVVATVRDALRN